ncbi:SusC/RagA family TonB-linked outer membrane protein [Reichenbachiella sp. 5M10]|uniref:SusC/RagA family TonB-linked outer membrane protein n=1 Tax=Reichenbachiella sp. 5M10 TaxID=1889772 RepID=UPI000C147DCE|nr:SusC/RagA family TonB-linked outer membrane protein [Reichenbachiella sp. 5M10]PIB35645.1 SusC/RagA family TonB-linked outer membrane protein [Reichenbachiella sp. 5M10]
MKRLFTLMKCCLFLVMCMGMSNLVQAQSKIVGKVTDDGDGSEIPGVNVMVKGTTVGTVTDLDGNYSLEVPADAEALVFSYIGYMKQEVLISGRSSIDVSLVTDVEQLEEVVVVGYGVQKKKEVTGAVASLKSDELLKNATPDIGDAMQGQIAGVNVQAASGRPGEKSNVQIRGIGSVNSGALGPLYVVDGVAYQNDPNIAPEQIESIEVLKDGAAAAIYGVRASNGVILITTKRGKPGRMQVDFSAYAGVQNITSGTPLMNTEEMLYVEEVKLAADGKEPLVFVFNPDALDYDTDFVGDVQNDNALMQSYNLNVAGGQENLTLSLNANYFKQDGVLINSGYDRLTTRLSGEYKLGKFRAFATVALTEENTQQEPWALYEYAVIQKPWQKGINDLETFGQNQVIVPDDNPIQYGFLSRQLNNEDNRVVNSSNVAINLEYEIIDGLSYQVNLGRNDWNYQRKFFQPQYLAYNSDGNLQPGGSNIQALLNEEFTFTSKNTLENILKFQRQFGKHNVGATLVLSYEGYTSKNVGVGVIGLQSNDTDVLSQGIEGTAPTGTESTQNLIGKMARVQYGFNEKYLLSASIRYDGSSNFGKENRYNPFYGISAGWNVSEEGFFKNASSLSFINNLKLRGSYAELGNQSIAPYQYASVIEGGVNYPFGQEGSEFLGVGNVQRRYANPFIQWETTISRNIGLDLSMLDGRFNFSADVYLNDKQDMLLSERLTPSSGTWQTRAVSTYNVRTINAGNMQNKGIELALGYRDETNFGLTWSVNGTFTKNVNEVTDLNGVEGIAYAGGRPVVSRGESTDYTTYLSKGYEGGAFFLLEHEGVIKTDEQLNDYLLLDPNARKGDMMYRDQLTVDTDGDGKADAGDGVINDNDRVYAGSGQPEFEAGLMLNAAFKGFDFYVQAYYSYGAEIYNGSKLYAYGSGRHKDLYYGWSPQNSDSDIMAARTSQEHNNTRARSDYFLEDGTYLRIRNITLGYTIPNSVLKDKVNKLRFYVTAQNPFTFTKYEGYDPEVGGDGLFTRGVDMGNYPVTRKFLAGLQLQF